MRQIRSGANRHALIVNGGRRQDVPQVHFHLFTGEAEVNPFDGGSRHSFIHCNETLMVFHHPSPNWQTHIVIEPKADVPALSSETEIAPVVVRHLIDILDLLNHEFELAKRGYAVCIQENGYYEQQKLMFHVVAGKCT